MGHCALTGMFVLNRNQIQMDALNVYVLLNDESWQISAQEKGLWSDWKVPQEYKMPCRIYGSRFLA